MEFPELNDWQPTRQAIHDAAMILNVLQVGSIDPMPYALQYSLRFTETGLSTYQMPFGGTLDLDLHWVPGLLHIKFDDADDVSYPLDGYSQVTMLEAVLGTLSENGFEPAYNADHVQNDAPFAVQTKLISDFGRAMDHIYTIFARVRARFSGYMTPQVVFAHHLDLSCLVFRHPDKLDEHGDSHINIGFSAGDDMISMPYIYLYGWGPGIDYPTDGFDLPDGATWETEAFKGVRIDYATILGLQRPARTLENMVAEVATGLYNLLP